MLKCQAGFEIWNINLVILAACLIYFSPFPPIPVSLLTPPPPSSNPSLSNAFYTPPPLIPPLPLPLSPPQTTDPEDYRLTHRTPPGCAPSECSFFAGIQTNEGDSSYLDFYLEGSAMGWIAIGVSATSNMVKCIATHS